MHHASSSTIFAIPKSSINKKTQHGQNIIRWQYVENMDGGLVAARRFSTRSRHHEPLEAVMNDINSHRQKTLHNPFVKDQLNTIMEEDPTQRTYFSKNSFDDSTHCHCETNSAELLLRYAFLHATPNRFSKSPSGFPGVRTCRTTVRHQCYANTTLSCRPNL